MVLLLRFRQLADPTQHPPHMLRRGEAPAELRYLPQTPTILITSTPTTSSPNTTTAQAID